MRDEKGSLYGGWQKMSVVKKLSNWNFNSYFKFLDVQA